MKKTVLFILCFCLPVILFAQSIKIVTNHVGYEFDKAKKAIVVADYKASLISFQLIDVNTNQQVYNGSIVSAGTVDKWKNWQFWTMDFSQFTTPGTYKLQVVQPQGKVFSYPFVIGKNVLEQATLSDVIYYFKGQRSSGLLDKADRHSPLLGRPDTVDAHGGWYDATGDYGKHLSHLTFSSYFNPQQIPFTAWSLFKTYELLSKRPGTDFRQFNRRLLDEAMYGADYLCRMQAKNGSFYRSVGAPGPGKLPQDRAIGPEGKSYRIKVSKTDDSFKGRTVDTNWRSYQCSYRSGGGMSIAALAIASTYKRCSAKTSNPIPLFGDLAAELAHWQDRDRNQKINAMAQMASTKLRAWVDEGPYARLFDRPTTVQLNNPWLYFNVEKLKDDPRLERAMSLLIAHTATYRASGMTGQPSIVLLDECWALLESPILAGVVVQLFRTARKRNASVWGISQTPEDFVGTPDRPNEHGAGIVKNATTKIIGKQPGDMTALRDHVHLNETALNQIKTFAHPKKGHSAEFLIAIGEKAESTHAIRVVPSPVDYWITTTYARERGFRKWWLRQHRRLPLIQAYEELAAQYPRGLAELAPLPVELSGDMQEALSQ